MTRIDPNINPDVVASHTPDGPRIVGRRATPYNGDSVDPFDALEHFFSDGHQALLEEFQADRALREGRSYSWEGGHGWERTGPSPHGPKVPSTVTLGTDGQPTAW